MLLLLQCAYVVSAYRKQEGRCVLLATGVRLCDDVCLQFLPIPMGKRRDFMNVVCYFYCLTVCMFVIVNMCKLEFKA